MEQVSWNKTLSPREEKAISTKRLVLSSLLSPLTILEAAVSTTKL